MSSPLGSYFPVWCIKCIDSDHVSRSVSITSGSHSKTSNNHHSRASNVRKKGRNHSDLMRVARVAKPFVDAHRILPKYEIVSGTMDIGASSQMNTCRVDQDTYV